MNVPTSSSRQRGLLRALKVTLGHTVIHALNVVLYLFMALLALVAGLLIFILTRDDIPLPDFLLRRIEARCAAAGADVTFSRARLDLHGNLLINDLRLQPARFGEPVLEARMVFLNFDELFLAAGMIELSQVRAEDVTIYCPSTLSPSGGPFPLARIAGLFAERSGRAWDVNGILLQAGPLHVVAHGTFVPPTRGRPEGPPPDPDELVNQFARLAPQIARALQPLDTLAEARVEVVFRVERSGEIQAAIEGSAGSWMRAGICEVDQLQASTLLRSRKGVIDPFVIQARASRFAREDGIIVERPALLAHWDAPLDLKRPMPSGVLASAARVQHPKIAVTAPAVAIVTADYPRVAGALTVDLAGEPLDLRIAGDANSRSGEVEIRGAFGAHWLEEASRIQGRDLTYYADIKQAPDFWAKASIGDGLVWRQAEFRAVSGPIVARRVALDRARVHGIVVPEGVTIDHLEIGKGDQGGLGTYTDAFATRDHRLLLRGSMRPLMISGWFSGWWERFWSDFTFDGPPPEFDIDVAGNWNVQGSDIVHGRGKAWKGSMRGVAYDFLDTRFFIKMDYYDLYQATVIRPEGRVAGEVQLQFTPPQRDPARVRFAFDSTADLVELATIFGKGGNELLAPYRYTTPPTTHVAGVVTNHAGAFDTRLDVSIESPAEFRYYDFPVSTISTDVKIHNTRVEIPRLLAGYGGGTLRASAVVENGIIALHGSLEDASYDSATRIFNDFLDRRSPPPAEEKDPAGLTAHAPGGRLDLGVDARGPLTTFDAYEGQGSLRISEANLGSVRIFGLLSDLMGSISPKLGSLRFHEANSTFKIQRDRVAFPDLRITGRTAALETEGTYYINSRNLDFRARLYPLGESGNAITQLFDFVLGPVSYLLEMRLTGTMRKPNWSLSRLPFAPKPVVDEGTSSPTATTPPPSPTPAPEPSAAPQAASPDAGSPPPPPTPP